MSTPHSEAVAAEVRAEMARQGVTATNVAQAANIGQANLSRKLNGHRDFSLPELIAVCDALGVTLSTVIERAESTAAA